MTFFLAGTPFGQKLSYAASIQILLAFVGRAIFSPHKMCIRDRILDEPTDHLDMESITALNNGLIKFPGVILFASRDHQVVQTTANRIIEFLPDGTFVDKVSTYDEYLENDEMARKRQVYSMSSDDEGDN